MSLVTVLPLTFVMIAGPQIISAVFLATSEGWARNSAAYVVGAALSISAVSLAAYLIATGAAGGSDDANHGGTGHTLDAIILALLLVAAAYVYVKREESEPPKWMGRLQSATPRFSFTLGFLLLGFFPTDIITSVTVGVKVARDGDPAWQLAGFVALTLFWLALPALLVLVMGKRAQEFLPKVRDWMNNNSWVVSEGVIALFVVIELKSLLS
jgi:hypothetical protein